MFEKTLVGFESWPLRLRENFQSLEACTQQILLVVSSDEHRKRGRSVHGKG